VGDIAASVVADSHMLPGLRLRTVEIVAAVHVPYQRHFAEGVLQDRRGIVRRGLQQVGFTGRHGKMIIYYPQRFLAQRPNLRYSVARYYSRAGLLSQNAKLVVVVVVVLDNRVAARLRTVPRLRDLRRGAGLVGEEELDAILRHRRPAVLTPSLNRRTLHGLLQRVLHQTINSLDLTSAQSVDALDAQKSLLVLRGRWRRGGDTLGAAAATATAATAVPFVRWALTLG